jgi:hypothetical protein
VSTYSPYSAYPSPEHEVPFQAGPPPILVAVADRAPQRRVTVLFRLILLIPHFFVLFFLAIAAEVVAFLGWWGALFVGRLPEFAHTFLSGVLRWNTRVYAYGLLLTDVYPRFTLDDDPNYPVRVAVPPQQRLNRAAVFFRIILAFPAGFVANVLAYGATTLMAVIAWLITLVAGQLPASFHQAYGAFLRFQTRYYGYLAMLTAAYPSGLYGDAPGTPTWADAAPTAPVQPGFGTPESVYGGPGTQGDYGYSYPAQPGYGYPAGYGAQPVFQPASWLLFVSAAAKRVIIAFIALGMLLFVADVGFQLNGLFQSVGQFTNVQTAQNALNLVNTSYSTLNKNLTSWESATEACDQNLTCVTIQDAKAAADFTAFDNQLTGTPMPSNSVSAASRLGQLGTESAQDFTQLSKVTSASQYESVFTSTGLQATLTDFNTQYNALVSALESN